MNKYTLNQLKKMTKEELTGIIANYKLKIGSLKPYDFDRFRYCTLEKGHTKAELIDSILSEKYKHSELYHF